MKKTTFVYLSIIAILLALLLIFNLPKNNLVQDDHVFNAFYDFEIYKEFKVKYPNSVDRENFGDTYTLRSSYTKGNDTIILQIIFNPITYFSTFEVTCVTDRNIKSQGGAYLEAFDFLHNNNCIIP